MKMKEFFTKVKKFNFIYYILLAVVVLFSYHQLLGMYFWRDDYTGLYLGQLANLSTHPGFAYPYHLALLLERYARQFFGLNASYYFLTVIILYVIASWLLFYFLKRLVSNLLIAFFSTLVFAAGFVGQDAMKMTMGDGLGTILALDILLAGFVTFLIYLQNGKKVWLVSSLIAFALTLEITPQRTGSSLLIFLALDWIISWKRKSQELIIRNVLFLLVFLIQYFLHPSVLLLGYKVNPPTQFWGLLVNLSPLYILNFLGTFWNMIIPTPLQEQFNASLGTSGQSLTLIKFWLTGLPTIFLAVTLFIYLKFLRPAIYSAITLGKIITAVVLFSLLWAMAIHQITIDKGDLVAIFNGGMWLIFLIVWIVLGIPKSKLLSLFSLLAIFGILAIFFITIPERVLVSYNRYLLLPSFTVALLPIIFITKEFYQKELRKRRLAQILLLAVVGILVLPRLIFAYTTQREFRQDYSQHAKRMYQNLHSFIPRINQPTIIYLEGVTKQLQFTVGDAARVGYFGSEVAYAVHYQTQKENIILPQTAGEIPGLLKKNPNLSYQDVYTFIYDKDGLRDTSSITRQLLAGPNQPISVAIDSWKEELSSNDLKVFQFTPTSSIWTLLPLEVKIPLKFSSQSKEKEMEMSWEYNTSGLITEDKFVKVKLLTDNLWHEYKFIIPAGGEYLQKVSFNFPTDTSVEIGTTQLDYLLDN